MKSTSFSSKSTKQNHRLFVTNDPGFSMHSKLPYTRNLQSITRSPPSVDDDIFRMHQDLQLLERKLADLNSDSGFVSNFRQSIDGDRNDISFSTVPGVDGKLKLLEEVLKKVIEVDRVVLRHTEPPNFDPVAAKGRVARGMDLNTIPTHLNIVDRLLDFHVHRRRNSTLISQPYPQNEQKSKASEAHTSQDSKEKQLQEKLISFEKLHEQRCQKYDSDVQNLQTSLRTLEANHRQTEDSLRNATQENEMLRKKIEALSTAHKQQPPPPPDPAPARDLRTELEGLRAQLTQSREAHRTLEEHLEATTAREQAVVAELLSSANAIRDDPHPVLPTGLHPQLPENILRAVRALAEAAIARIQATEERHQMEAASGLHLEQKYQSVVHQRDLMGVTINQMTTEAADLRAQYSRMEAEFVGMQNRLQELQLWTGDRANISKHDFDLLQQENQENKLRAMAVPMLEKSVQELQQRLTSSDLQQIGLHTEITELRTELGEYKDLTETLKVKIRGLGSRDNKQFLDTFEEVMRDEMMTMKRAFEAKLAAAREEVDEIARKHQMELRRLQTRNPLLTTLSASSTAISSTVIGVGKSASPLKPLSSFG